MKEIRIVATQFYYECPCWLIEDRSIQLVKIKGNCTKEEVDALLYGILGYNDIDLSTNPKESLTALMENMREGEVIMSGGLLFQEDQHIIMPSCCCGLEQWKEIVSDIQAKRKPWLGHDPWGTCIYENDKTIVCSDDVNSYKTEEKEKIAANLVQITFTDSELDRFFHQIELDMQEFVFGPLRTRLLELVPEIATEFCAAWLFCFCEKNIF